jgi:hypothetical protein
VENFVRCAHQASESSGDDMAEECVVQRFWLTVTRLGLQLEMTPVILSRYVRKENEFSRVQAATETASRSGKCLAGIFQDMAIDQEAFFGRIGNGKAANSRSLRLPVERLRHTR